jgi:hypothetical protein
MNKVFLTVNTGLLALLISIPVGVMAAGMVHGQHGDKHSPLTGRTNHPNAEKQKLLFLAAIPASGKSREAGFDGRYVMEALTDNDYPDTRCHQASRGLIMLDRAAWTNCGTRPAGLPVAKTTLSSSGGDPHHSNGHMNH